MTGMESEQAAEQPFRKTEVHPTRILEWPTSLQMSQILIMTLAKTPRPQRFFLASLAYMDVGQGRKQDAEALRLCESHDWDLIHL